jgi:hypothetical protein
VFTTYHPLLVESHFSILIATLLLGDFASLLPGFARAAALVDGLEGYPVFLPARSMAQAEFIEVLERLAGGWENGTRPHSLAQKRLAIEAGPSQGSSSKHVEQCDRDAPDPQSGRASPLDEASSFNPAVALDCLRILLAPVAARQREKAEKAAVEKATGGDAKKPLALNIPLHGPRVEIILAWLAGAHLPVLDSLP